MLPCIYTKDKKKKLKKWEEGFYKYNNKKITLYDSDKKLLCTKVTDLNEEIDTFKYFIYIENCNTRRDLEIKEYNDEPIQKNDNIDLVKSDEFIQKNDNIDLRSNTKRTNKELLEIIKKI